MLKPKILKTIKEHNLIRRGDKVLVAVSGGPDSVVMLFLLWQLQKELGIKLQAAHLNHLIRGAAADKDEKFVKNLAKSLHINICTQRISVPQYASRHKLSLEDAARRVRYDFLERTAKRVGANKIALGHHSDDQVETFLMRLIRGSGAKGLRGILPQRGRIIRPLIDCWRTEIEEHCRLNGLKYRVDHTNFQTKYLRNKIRQSLLPSLLKYNPNIKLNLKNTAELLGEDFYLLNDLAERALDRLTVKKHKKEIVLNRAEFDKLPHSMHSYVLRRAIEEVKGDLVDISLQNIKDIVCQSGSSFEIDLPGELWVLGEKDVIKITKSKPHKPHRVVFEYRLNIPGETEIPEIGGVIEAEIKTLAPRSPGFSRSPGFNRGEIGNPKRAFLDAEKFEGDLIVRNWEPGDKFRPFGMRQGTKKLQDFFVDNKIPLKDRYKIPVVESNGQIVWVGGQRIDDRFKVSNCTRKVLMLKLL